VYDALTGDEFTIPAKTIINAAGVWAGRIEVMAGQSKVAIKPAKGVHLTLPRDALPTTEYAVVLPETPDGRLLFIVPWTSRVTLGTTDTKGGDIDQPIALEEDIAYLIEAANAYLKTKIRRDQVISAWAGYRPLISPAGADEGTSKLSRTHVVLDGPGGMITIAGGKLTSYRRMAQDAIDHLDKRLGKTPQHVTETMPLDGKEGYEVQREELKKAAEHYDWSDDVVTRLSAYGGEAATLLAMMKDDSVLAHPIVPDLPYVFAEVAYACRSEMAMTLDDVLTRRLHLNFEDWSQGVASAPRVAEVMARELGWGEAETTAQVSRYKAKVAAEKAR
jgi:glycerol-3-phosphate dehydrogenase